MRSVRGLRFLLVAGMIYAASAVSRNQLQQGLSARSRRGSLELESESDYTFDEFKLQFGKQYADEEEHSMREALFNTRRTEVVAHNLREKEGHHSHRLGINQFSDLTLDEMKAKHMGYASSKGGEHVADSASMLQLGGLAQDKGHGSGGDCTGETTCPRNSEVVDLLDQWNKKYPVEEVRKKLVDKDGAPYVLPSIEDIPKEADWRDKMTPVKGQGGCGSCWAFAATAVMEGYANMVSGKSFDLSEQNLVDCTPNPHKCGGDGGCKGATSELAFAYVGSQGQVAESNRKYKAETNDCPADLKDASELKLRGSGTRPGAVVGVTTGLGEGETKKGFANLPQNSYIDLLHAASQGPLTISVDAGAWQSYSSGILKTKDIWSDSNSNLDINHAVVLVGYGEEDGEKYWIVRNSWGSFWGEDGYLKIERNENDDKPERCRVDVKPCDGIACEGDCAKHVVVCGTSGILYCSSYPVKVQVLDSSKGGDEVASTEQAMSPEDTESLKEINTLLDDFAEPLKKEPKMELNGLLSHFQEKTGKPLLDTVMEQVHKNPNAASLVMNAFQRHPNVVQYEGALKQLVMGAKK